MYWGQAIFALTSLIQLNFPENHLNLLRGRRVKHGDHDCFDLTQKESRKYLRKSKCHRGDIILDPNLCSKLLQVPQIGATVGTRFWTILPSSKSL